MPSKKRRLTAQHKSAPDADGLDRQTYRGWCPIESDPAFFTAILHDLGVSGLIVEEILSLDDVNDTVLPSPAAAVIFLFRYSDVDSFDQETEDATDHSRVWFARQLPLNACASVAMLNIVNNAAEVQLGPELRTLRESTTTASPFEKGQAIAENAFIRHIHSSFARELDIYQSDLSMKWKYEKLARQVRAKSRKTPVPPAAEAIVGQRRSGRKRPQKPTPSEDDDDLLDDDSAFHFIAYMPIDDKVWKLDGMDRCPQQLGSVPEDGDWLRLVREAVQARMMQYDGSQVEFNLMAVLADPATQARERLLENLVTTRVITGGFDGIIDAVHFADTEHGITAEDIDAHFINLSGSPLGMDDELPDLQLERMAFRSVIQAGKVARAAVAEKARLRRHDYKPFLTAWLQALRKQGSLDTLKAKIGAGA